MEMTPDTSKGNYQIRSYAPGKIVINNEAHTQSVIVSLEKLLPWEPHSFTALKPEHFKILLEQRPQVILLGTGEQQIFPAPDLLKLVVASNIGLEVMSTAAACRTFNVLAAEGRNVVAGLLIN